VRKSTQPVSSPASSKAERSMQGTVFTFMGKDSRRS
jgi:hypothetical protein